MLDGLDLRLLQVSALRWVFVFCKCLGFVSLSSMNERNLLPCVSNDVIIIKSLRSSSPCSEIQISIKPNEMNSL